MLDLYVWGAGGDIGPRFELLSFEYRLTNEPTYRKLAATLHRQDAEYKILKLVVPPFPAGTVGTLEYRFEVTLDDNDVQAVIGKKRVKIGAFPTGVCVPVTP
jgi:hypothetical protein